MFTLNFDCRELNDRQDFYQQLIRQYTTDAPFGDSLDALWDWLTGELPLPLKINFSAAQKHQFNHHHPLAPIIDLLLEAQETLGNQLVVVVNQRPLAEWLTAIDKPQ